MKVWVLRERGPRAGYWTGIGLMFSQKIEDAVWLVRRCDAARMLVDNLLLPAMPAEVEVPSSGEAAGQKELPSSSEAVGQTELPDRDEPGAQSAAIHHGDGGAANSRERQG